RLVLVESLRIVDRDRRDEARVRLDRRAFVAIRDRDAGGKAGRVGVLGADPGGISLEAEPFEGRADLGPRGTLASDGRLCLAGVAIDPVDLGQPVARCTLQLI